MNRIFVCGNNEATVDFEPHNLLCTIYCTLYRATEQTNRKCGNLYIKYGKEGTVSGLPSIIVNIT